MKKKIVFLFSVLTALFFSYSVYAAMEPAFFDFSDYANAGQSPKGWICQNTGELSPGKVDEAHGTSLKVEYKGIPRYVFSETISEGKFLISFEAYFADYDMNMRLHVYSPAAQSDDFSVFRFNRTKIQSMSKDWSSTDLAQLETDKWYQVDILFDLDGGKINYYIDGNQCDSRKIGFTDFSAILFRTNDSGVAGSTCYLDNVTFKYLSDGTFTSVYSKSPAPVGTDEVELSFSDLVDASSLNDIKVYSMGTNPISLTEREIAAEIKEAGIKKAVIKLSEPIEAETSYKISIPNAKSIFGNYYTNDSTYFAAGGAFKLRTSLNADFTTVPGTAAGNQIIPEGDAEWIKGGRASVNLVFEGENNVRVVNMPGNKGNAAYPNNYVTLTRTLDKPSTNECTVEFKLKSANGGQIIKIRNGSDDKEITFLQIAEDKLVFAPGEECNYIADEWMTIRADIKDGFVNFFINGESAACDVPFELDDIKTIIFEKQNADDTYGTDVNVDTLPKLQIEYFKLGGTAQCESVLSVCFEDDRGNVYYPDKNIPSDVTKMKILFSGKIDETSIENGVSIVGVNILKMECKDNEYVCEFEEYLDGDSDYDIDIKDEILDAAGYSIASCAGTIHTEKGFYRVNKLDVQKITDGISITADIVHTDASYSKAYLAYASYIGNLMTDYQCKEIIPAQNERHISVADTYTYPPGTETVCVYLWDGFDTMIPLYKFQSVDF